MCVCVGVGGCGQEPDISCGVCVQGEESDDSVKEQVVFTIEADTKPGPALPRAIILELSACNFLDTVGVKTLSNVSHHLAPA